MRPVFTKLAPHEEVSLLKKIFLTVSLSFAGLGYPRAFEKLSAMRTDTMLLDHIRKIEKSRIYLQLVY